MLYLKWIITKNLLYNTGNSAQCYVAVWMGGEFGMDRYTLLYFKWVHPKGDQAWVFIGRTDVEAETSTFWPSDAKS